MIVAGEAEGAAEGLRAIPLLALPASAQEALELGLADRIEQPVRMAAHFDLSRFRNPPPQLAALGATPSPQEDDM